jgi:ElaB/YqjD/DUF883 family membrane-anchored ribosome-binding protein
MARPDDEVNLPASRNDLHSGRLDDTSSSEPSVNELKAEISQTQVELQQTVAEIQERLSPANLAAEARTKVRDATLGKVTHMAERAGETANRVADRTRRAAERLPAPVRQNPIPLTLMGVGAAWLIVSQWRDRSSHHNYSSRERWDALEAMDDSRDEMGMVGEYGESDIGSPSRGMWGETSAQQHMGSRSEQRRRSRRQMQAQIAESLRSNPLPYGIAAMAAGALIGSLMPRTEMENEYMGEARDTLVHSAREMAESTVERMGGESEIASTQSGGPGSAGTGAMNTESGMGGTLGRGPAERMRPGGESHGPGATRRPSSRSGSSGEGGSGSPM